MTYHSDEEVEELLRQLDDIIHDRKPDGASLDIEIERETSDEGDRSITVSTWFNSPRSEGDNWTEYVKDLVAWLTERVHFKLVTHDFDGDPEYQRPIPIMNPQQRTPPNPKRIVHRRIHPSELEQLENPQRNDNYNHEDWLKKCAEAAQKKEQIGQNQTVETSQAGSPPAEEGREGVSHSTLAATPAIEIASGAAVPDVQPSGKRRSSQKRKGS